MSKRFKEYSDLNLPEINESVLFQPTANPVSTMCSRAL